MFDIDDVDEAKRMLPIYKRAVDLLETVSGKKTEQAEQEMVDGVLPCPFCGDSQPTVFERSTFRWRVAVCNNCGAYAPEVRHDTLAEDQKQAGIESDAAAITAWNTRAAPVEPVEQEPVAWRVRGYNQFKTGNPASWRYVDSADKPAVNKPDCCDFEPLYAAPVRTKDLTDDEIEDLYFEGFNPDNMSLAHGFARAVIAADREKNK